EHAEGEGVGVHDPLELRAVDVESPLHRRQGHVHDRVVEHDHEQPERDSHEGPPLAGLRGEEPGAHRPPRTCLSAVVFRPVSDFVWNPTPAIVEAANLTRLSRLLGCSDYRELHRVSIEEPERFWPALVDDLGPTFPRGWTP